MALSDLAIFNEFAYQTSYEVLNQNINLFNAATRGGIVLGNGSHQGSFSDKTFWKNVAAVQVRNINAETAISQVTPNMGQYSSVKLARRSDELIFQKAHMRWIQQNPEQQGVIYGQQLAQQMFVDMLKAGLSSYVAAIGNQATNYYDGSAGNVSFASLLAGAAKFGDQSDRIVCWVMNSKCAFDLLGTNLTNAAHLFTYANVNVHVDPQGRPIIVTDNASLIDLVPTPDQYLIPGLTSGAIVVTQNDDFAANEETRNGKEQIVTSYQAEWSIQLELKGFTWDKTNGGTNPSYAALATASNWDKVATDYKDLAGVLVRTL